ncbi:MAG TPA: glycolate oxidase subunit GlcD [Chromatiales bacterium]|nr:glycolate oxidase subunit GlcD [Thiotrichales bacterium]HIP68982.1 glycolate oxidase subunit GlcD [Chromatiales bacterium]
MLPDHTPAALSSEQKQSLINGLATLLPDNILLYKDEDLHPYECDGLSVYRQTPLAVALPETIEQIKAILRYCSDNNLPVVARGAGTGLSGGAYPLADGVLLGLSKFNRILKIDPDARTATVEPGVRNLAISEAVAQHNLFYAPDPSSQIACSIGGNVAENSGGVHCLKYGLTVHNILQLKILTMDGELLTVGSEALDSPGYDLLALMTGSEGLLGIITEITVKLLPKPERVQVLLAAFDNVETAGEAVANIIANGIIPAGLEMMDNPSIRASEDFVHAGYPVDAAAILLCELDGGNEEVSELVMQVRELLLSNGAVEVRTAESDEERARFWAGRKSAFPAVGRISPDYYCMDGTIPRKALGKILAEISRLSEQYQLQVANVFHAGDGNLHPLILYDANNPGELEKAEKFGGEILTRCVEVGGTITGEHGVGIEKLDQMCVQFTAEELEQLHAIKSAFDPQGLLNPGKAVPTLHRCAEFGAMHVHKGELPFPELPRF